MYSHIVALRWCPRGMRWHVCKPTAHAMRTCIRGPGAARPVRTARPHTCRSRRAPVPLFSPSARGPGGGLRPIGNGGPAAAALHAGPDGGRRRYGCMAGRWRARRRQMAPRHWPTSACTCRCNCKLWGVLSVYSHTQLSSGHTRRYAMHATLHTQLKLVHQQFILHNCTTQGSMKGHVMDAVYRVMCDRVASTIPRHQWLYLNNCSNTQQSVSQVPRLEQQAWAPCQAYL